jgi:hypothetical protein
MDPPRASRAYALLSLAQHATLVEAAGADKASPEAQPLSLGAALAGASEAVLSQLFPGHAVVIATRADEDIAALVSAGARADDIAAGESLGRLVAGRVLEHAASDGSGAAWAGTVPAGEGIWFSSDVPAAGPLLPQWKDVRPWLMHSGDEFRPPPPPAIGSPEFQAALAEVRAVSDTRTSAQIWTAHFWSDALGTHTPPGHWNGIATVLMEEHQVTEREATRALALLNMALMDAGIACWDAKYTYWLMRPSQADPEITVPVMLPNFPSYVSGHATFSGAASAVLEDLFPLDAGDVRAMAEEAAISRLYGGIHYRFDNERGLELGRRIGELAIAARGKSDAAAPWARYLR